MAHVIITWDLPPQPAQMEEYKTRSKGWIDRVLSQPGVVEWRALRNPLATTPQVLIMTEFDSLASARAWAESSELAALIAELRSTGCANLVTQVWDKSPIAPEPRRP
jgi:heme-degrading monooxygenase HmoA